MKKKYSVKKKVHNATVFGLPTDTNVKSSEKSKSIQDALQTVLGWPGSIMFGSKSTGFEIAEKNKLIYHPNGNIFTEDGCKVWYGDWMSKADTVTKIQEIAKKFNTTFYFLREHAGRFLSAPPNLEYLQDKAEVRIDGYSFIKKVSE